MVELGSGLLLSDSSVLNFMSIQDCAVGVCLFNPALRVRAWVSICDLEKMLGKEREGPCTPREMAKSLSVTADFHFVREKSSIFFPFFQPASSIQGRRGVLE